MFNSHRCTHLNKASADPTYTIQQIRTFSAIFSICAHIPNLKLYHLLEDWKYSDTYCEKILFQTYLLIDIFCIIDAAHSPQSFYLTSRCRTLHAGIVNRIPFSVICVPSYFFTVTHSGSSKVFFACISPVTISPFTVFTLLSIIVVSISKL